MKEVQSLKESSMSSSPSNQRNRRREVFSSESDSGYRKCTRIILEDMTEDQYKSFHVSIK